MRRLLALSALVLATWPATAAPNTGVEGLCEEVQRLLASHLSAAPGVAVETVAEGPALSLADAVDARCRAQLERPAEEVAPWRVRLKVRVAPPLLLAVVELFSSPEDARDQAVLVDVADVPLGSAMEAWLGATGAGAGVETWLAGAVPGQVLALCGGDGDGDGIAEVALVTPAAVEVFRWTHGGLEPHHRIDLPAQIRPRARVPAATAVCQATDEGLLVAVGVHDRNQGMLLKVTAEGLSAQGLLEGVPVGWAKGAPVLAQGVRGRGLLRLKGRDLVTAVAVPARGREPPRILGVTQDGAVLLDDRKGAALVSGTGLAVVDLDGDGAFELVRTRPLVPGVDGTDRLVVTPIEEPAAVRLESAPVSGLLDAVGAVSVGRWWRVLAVRPSEGRSTLYALGTRTPAPGSSP